MKKKIFKMSSTFLLALSGVAISMSSGIYRFAITPYIHDYFNTSPTKVVKNDPSDEQDTQYFKADYKNTTELQEAKFEHIEDSVSEGPLPMDEVELLLGGSAWYDEKSTYSHTGFKFEFEDDGTFTITDNYRISSARITGKGTWTLTAKADSDQTHSSNFTNVLGDDYYIIEVENFETTQSIGYYVDVHLAIAKDVHALVYHIILGSTAASTQYGNAKKIA